MLPPKDFEKFVPWDIKDFVPGRIIPTQTMPPKKKKIGKFSIGETVFLMSRPNEKPDFNADRSNPYWPEIEIDKEPIFGSIVAVDDTVVRVAWSNHQVNIYPINSGEVHPKEDWAKLQETLKEEKIKGVDLKKLEDLVISPEKHRSIVSVLKQHQFSDKIFVEWGLGEVIEYGKGMTLLFYGPPGTGKTFAAHCIAKSLGKKLEIVDNAKLQSSVPGEMERNIKEAFRVATQKNQILMFDECDSLIMSRSNVGMILGSEINCLLTEIEKFEGVCILTTNRIGELDEALERRISLIVKFPKPDEEQRKKIWQRFLPKKLPLSKDVSLDELVKHELTGGLIKNVVLGAARYAVAEDRNEVCMDDFLYAIKHVSSGTRAFDAPSNTPRAVGYIKK